MMRLTSQRGETIVEVLICLAALGFMLLSAFTLTNHNQATNQASQERSRATKVMETQLELLRGYTVDGILPAGTFCLKAAATDQVDAVAGGCVEDGLYNVSIENPNPSNSKACAQDKPLKIKVNWTSLIKSTPEELNTYYIACNKFTQTPPSTSEFGLAAAGRLA
ncbi:MAG: type IV pilus modification PilV family protein [Candidatus Saccharimonadales bacterium]